jgi:RNA-directed DNA polymerase
MESHKGWQPTERGTPQGAVMSPLLSNIYLDGLDHLMSHKGYQMVRYADDFIILCRTQKEAQGALEQVQQWTRSRELRLHPQKTRIVDATVKGGFDFLGYHFERGYRWPRQKSLKALREKVRTRTKRTNGTSMSCIIGKLNPILKGWFGYYKHSHPTTFEPIDGWVRMRLRSILRKRRKGQGAGRGLDHRRWPNRYFAALGLFSLKTARELARQSP